MILRQSKNGNPLLLSKRQKNRNFGPGERGTIEFMQRLRKVPVFAILSVARRKSERLYLKDFSAEAACKAFVFP